MEKQGSPMAVAGTSHQGSYSAKAGAITHSQTSTLEITLTCDPGWIRFWRKVSCEGGPDKLVFAVDGSRKQEWTGNMDWAQISYKVPAGIHTFTWTYGKDASDSDGADTVWLDDIEFPVW
jgi:hypothetical protein